MESSTIHNIVFATTFRQRLLGLMGRRSLPVGEVWIFPRCRSIHTWFMRMPIDVVFLDAEHRVLKIEPSVRPWHICCGPTGTVSVLEAASGWQDLAVGDPLPVSAG